MDEQARCSYLLLMQRLYRFIQSLDAYEMY
jgi:hypothetical protein